MWMLGLLAFMVFTGEALLRLYAPSLSYEYSLLKASKEFADLPEAAILEQITYRGGPGMSVYCGLIGVGLMIIAAVYPIFRRIKLFRWLASNTMWFDFHLMAGLIGPMFIGLHCALKLDTWVSAAFWSMVIVVISGLLGRYLYTLIPELSSGVELEELDHERAFQAARPRYPVPMAEIDRELADLRSRAQRVATSPSVLYALFWLLKQDIGRVPLLNWDIRNVARRSRLKQLGIEDRRVRKDLVRRAARMIIIARRQVVAPKAQLLLNSWKKVHVPFTILLTGFSAVHIWDAWSRAW
jgi:hypothetical protein